MPGYVDQSGANQQIELSVGLYQEALKANMSLAQHINNKYPTSHAKMSTFEQLCESSGLILSSNKEFGLRPPTLGAILDGSAVLNAVTVQDKDPASRILYPAVILELIESKLAVDRQTDPSQFDRMVGLDTSVTSNHVEQPVIDLTKAEAGRSKAISQLAPPQRMLTITTKDTSKRLPTFSLGLEVSDEALMATTLDFVTLAVNRQAEVERNARTYEYLKAFLKGDLDDGTSALSQTKADTYDSAIVANGKVTKKALVKWLVRNYYIRQINWVVTDIDGALAIEEALATTNTNQHVPGGLLPSFSLVNRMIANLNLFVVDASAGWDANTIMGLDSRYAIHRIRNSAAAYSAVEQFVLRRSNALRFDFSEIANRWFDDAFDTLSLVTS